MGFWRKIAFTLGFASAIAGSASQQTTPQQVTQQEQRDDYSMRLNRIMELENIQNPSMYANPTMYIEVHNYVMLKQTLNFVQEITLNLFHNKDANNLIRVIKYLHGDERGGVLLRDAGETFLLSSPNAQSKEAIEALHLAILYQN